MRLPYETDDGVGSRASFGLILLQEDATIESEFARLLSANDIGLYHSRIVMQADVSPGSLASMLDELPKAAAMLPTSVDFDVIGYACTSAATVIGSSGIEAAIQRVFPGAQVTDPIRAILAACRALQVHRIAYISPYIATVSAAMRRLLETNGLTITSCDSFEQSDDRIVAKISPSSILSAIEQVAMASDCDAVFVSCTNLRILDIITQAERTIGKPVLSSNLALAWHMRHLAGIHKKGVSKKGVRALLFEHSTSDDL